MKFLVTGANGTVAPVVVRQLERAGHAVAAWDRTLVPPEDAVASTRFLDSVSPDCVIHAAMGSPDWAAALARHCDDAGSRMLFVSSSSVFSGRGTGPRGREASPDSEDDYGRYKIECERAVIAANPRALVVRIGWQIANAPGGNNMLTYLADRYERDGAVHASTRWFPACSFLEDTAEAFAWLITRDSEGIYHVDSNPGLTFFEIASGLNRRQGSPWRIVASDEPVLDTRLADERVPIAPLSRRLAGQAAES